MTDFTYQQSLPLKLLPSYGRHDFVVGESNHEAVNLVDNFYKSKIYGLIITGPSASGKSHLVSTLQNKNKYTILEANDINEEKINIFELRNTVVENIQEVDNHIFFLHIINIIKEKNYKVLLTSRVPVNQLDIKLADLNSRLLAYVHTKILLPTDDVLRGIIIKISKDKGLLLSNLVINFILNHLERSYLVIYRFINELDQLSLVQKKKITIPLIKTLLK
ncbi:MAG: hypothetical protein CMJ06_02410 [Pelagibacterales bacterium]|nr:hypothetical protein [Pelagibacterales bacterium]|tara:strand:+ start:3163 stop:3822 length:660 start_codon:yes stop_codon:yes gene_type:complete